MVLRETRHTYNSAAEGVQTGHDLDAPLETYKFNWAVGGTC
jgi:hypothetical protein